MFATFKRLKLWYDYKNNRERARMINRALDFCKYTRVAGDYFEFGVYRGATCAYAFRSSRLRGLSDMRIYAFDSFEGLSEPKAQDDATLVKKGDRTCTQEDFRRNLKNAGVDDNTLIIVPGFFEDTLEGVGKARTKEMIGKRHAGIVYIDCDLFEPTYAVLNFIKDFIVDGSVIIFDNWFLFRGDPELGERKAFEVFARENPQLSFTQFHKFGWHGESFIVHVKSS